MATPSTLPSTPDPGATAVDAATARTNPRYPSISLLLPLGGETPWAQRLAALRDEAERRLRAEFGDAIDRRLLDRLDATVAGATAPRAAASLGVFVNADVADVTGIGVPVRERVVIDDTFATRDLVATALRQPRFWVLALSLNEPRLLRARNGRLTPRPLTLATVTPHPSTGRANRGVDRRTANEVQRDRRIRAIDAALVAALGGDDHPLVIVGTDPTLPHFLRRTRTIDRVGATVRMAPPANLDELDRCIAPAVAEMLHERRERTLAALARAVDDTTAVSGLDQVWRAIHRRTRGVLVVEASFEQPARIDERGIAPTTEVTAPDVVDDAVDDAIEAVLEVGGSVEIVPDGTLAAHQRIALIPIERGQRHR